jgi:glycosyltransferase involved in cell wall biosynthesis
MKRVLHLPAAVGGMPWALAQGERSLGLESQVLYKSSDWLGYPYDACLGLENVRHRMLRYKTVISAFISIRRKFDVFHFNYGQTLITSERLRFPHMDLPFYPKSAKLFVTYNGCDARQKLPTLERTSISACQDPSCYGGICNSGEKDRIRRKGIEKMARYVRHIWAVNPDLLYFLPKDKSSFLPYAVIGEEKNVGKPGFENRRLRIVHAPTNRGAKGSELIIATMRDLEKTKGGKFEFQLVENVPHAEAMRILSEADVLIDQILIGWYGGIAVELMSMGKPVICRIAEEDLRFIPRQMAREVKEAFIQAGPEELREVILQCVEGDRSFLKRKSEAALNYASTWHDPKYVAGITKEAYES